MAQRIVLIHGRNTKPAKAVYEQRLRRALVQGLERSDSAKASRVSNGSIPVDFIYYGDINNALLSKKANIRKKLTDRDPDFGNKPCLPIADVDSALDRLETVPRFTKSVYRKILNDHPDQRWRDDAARAISTIAAITTATLLNEAVIKLATADMGAYLMTRTIGSKVRTRLQEPLQAAFKNRDDVCLVSHSMGCIVSYDVLWKFSRMSEYANVRACDPKIGRWVTLGCPLGEAGVKRNLYDAHERGHDRFPQNIVKEWFNIAAQDDFIAHDSTMRDDYRRMRSYGFVDQIKDQKVYNCLVRDDGSDPHSIYGYLGHSITGKAIADWIT